MGTSIDNRNDGIDSQREHFLEQDILGASTHQALEAAHRMLAGSMEEHQEDKDEIGKPGQKE